MPKNITRTTVETTDDSGRKITNETEIEQPSIWNRATPIATIVGIFVAIITAWGTIFGYFRQIYQDKFTQKMEIETKARESKKVFLDKQSEIYFEAVSLVGEIVTKKTPTDKDLSDFDAMYWGPLPMVADENVSQAIIIVERSLHKKPTQKAISIDNGCLTDASLLLAHCVKQSLEKSWSVVLGKPSELPCDNSGFKDIHDNCGELR
jgi:hypothetical protein